MKTQIENTATSQSLTGRVNAFVIAAGILIAVICSLVVFQKGNAVEVSGTSQLEIVRSFDVKFPSVAFQLPVASLRLPVPGLQ